MSRNDPELDRVLAETLDALEQEGSTALEAACVRHPQLASDLRRRLEILSAANLLDLDESLERLPERLGDFEPLERLGEGAMGVVHRARQTSTGRVVALKLVRPGLLIFPESRARFSREVELTARLHHASILPVLAVGETSGLPWFAVELVRGMSLATLIERLRARFLAADAIDVAELPELFDAATPESLRGSRRLAVPRSWRDWALGTSLAVARAVAHAHEKGVLHRDVKPSNVLLGDDGRVWLTDFGLARDVEEGSLTRSGSTVGSLAYMAPEVLGGSAADTRSDVYGLGALTYELLTLHRPFEAASAAALMRAILDTSPTPPRRHAPSLGADEEAVVLHALERDPRGRYATAYEFAEDLERLLEHRPTRARPAGPWLRARRLAQRRPGATAAVLLSILFTVGTPSVVAWNQARARARLEEVNAELDQALVREREQRLRADENLDRAVRAVDTLLTETSSVLLDDVPLMQTLKRDLLERALLLLAELTPQDASSPQRVLQATAVDLSAGMAQLDLGESAAARAHFRAGLARLDGCAECDAFDLERASILRVRLLHNLGRAEARHDPAESERAVRATLAVPVPDSTPSAADTEVPVTNRMHAERILARLALHDAAYGAGRRAEAQSELDAAAEELEAYGDTLTRRDRLWLRSKVLGVRGTGAYFDTAQRDQAEADLRAALDALAELARLDPESMAVRADSLALGVNLAAVQLAREALDEAEATLEAAREQGERLVQLFPRALKYRTDLAGLLINLGLVRQNRGDVQGCREAWEAAAATGRAVAGEQEPTSEALMQAGIALGNLASLERDELRFGASIAAALEAELLLDRALGLKPGHTLVARSLEFAKLTRGLASLALEQFDEARDAIESAERVAPPDALAHRALVDSWLELALASEEDEQDELLERALDALLRAVDLGWNQRDDLERNTDLDPLRQMPGFPKLP